MDVEVLEATGVVVPSGVLVPDIVVARAVAAYTGGRALAADDILAVIEVVSPSTKTDDRRWKPEA